MLTSQECTTPESASKKKRAQLDHALIDVDFFHKPTIKALRRRYKLAGLVAYQEILFQISRATDAEIEADTALASAEEFEIIESEEFLAYCLYQNLLSRSANGKITQVRVAEDQERLAKNRDDYRRRQGKHRDTCVTDTEKTRDTTQNKRVSVNTEDLNTEDLNTEDLKKEEKREAAHQVPIREGCKFVRLSDISYESLVKTYLTLGISRETLESTIRGFDDWKGRKIAKNEGGWASVADDANALSASWVIQGALKLQNELERLNKTKGTNSPRKINWDRVFECEQ